MLVIPENEVLTTQAAANVLGVSRPHFVSLLDNDEIPYHTVGTHRRVHFGDVNAYREKGDQRSIHRNYNGWIEYLEQDIRRNLQNTHALQSP